MLSITICVQSTPWIEGTAGFFLDNGGDGKGLLLVTDSLFAMSSSPDLTKNTMSTSSRIESQPCHDILVLGKTSFEQHLISIETQAKGQDAIMDSEFSLENKVFKPIFFVAGWPNHGKIPFWLWENSAILLWPLLAPCVMCLVCRHMWFPFCLGLLLCCLGRCRDFWEETWENSTISLWQLPCCCVCCVWFAFALFMFFTFTFSVGIDFW